MDYTEGKDIEEIAVQLIKDNELLKSNKADQCKIYYLFKNKQAAYLGKCSLAAGKWKYLTGANFVIEFVKPLWDDLDDNQKKAAVFHELLHIGFDEKEKDGKLEIKWGVVKHDIEEFGAVVKKYGAWHDALHSFIEDAKNSDK